MKNKVVVLGLLVVVSLWVSFATSVQSAYARNSPRDIAISRCVIQALRRYPTALAQHPIIGQDCDTLNMLMWRELPR